MIGDRRLVPDLYELTLADGSTCRMHRKLRKKWDATIRRLVTGRHRGGRRGRLARRGTLRDTGVRSRRHNVGMAAREPHRKAGEALANSPQLRMEVARMRVDFRRQGKNPDHLSDEAILEGINEVGRKLPRVSDRPGGASYAEAKRQFAASLPDLPAESE